MPLFINANKKHTPLQPRTVKKINHAVDEKDVHHRSPPPGGDLLHLSRVIMLEFKTFLETFRVNKLAAAVKVIEKMNEQLWL